MFAARFFDSRDAGMPAEFERGLRFDVRAGAALYGIKGNGKIHIIRYGVAVFYKALPGPFIVIEGNGRQSVDARVPHFF